MRNPSLLLGLSDPGKNHEENPAFDRSSIVVEEIKKLVVEKPSVEWSELRPGSFYLITGARSSDSAFLFQLDRTEVASLFGAPDYRVTARPSEHISNLSAVEIGSFAEKIHVVHADLRPMVLGTDNVSKYTFTEFTEEEFHKFGEKLIPHINFAPEARYRRTEFQSSEQDYLSFISLHGLQYTRWAMYEETPDKFLTLLKKPPEKKKSKNLKLTTLQQ